MKKNMRISLLTATGQHNVGDELIIFHEINQIQKKYPKAKIFIFTYDYKSSFLEKKSSIHFLSYFPYNFRKNPFKNIQYFFKNIITLYKSSLVIIGGGGLLYEQEKEKRNTGLFLWKIRLTFLKLLRKEIFFLSLGINLKDATLKKWKNILSGENIHLSVREKKVQKQLKKIHIPAEHIPDPVLFHTRVPGNKNGRRIGIALRKGYLREEKKSIESILFHLIQKGFEPILLPHSFHPYDTCADDYNFLLPYAKRFQISITKNIFETLEAYSHFDFIIGMRLHSMILSYVYNIPFIGIPYGEKTKNFCEEIEYPLFLESNFFSVEKFYKFFEILVNEGKKIELDFKETSSILRKEIPKKLSLFLQHERTRKEK